MKSNEVVIGSKLNRLTVIDIIVPEFGKRRFTVMCECGNQIEVASYSFISGHTKSCGCFRKETARANKFKHGLKRHPLYSVWSAMKERCYKITNKSYPDYGAKGVVVCKEWFKDFKSFYDWCISNGWKRGSEVDKDKKPIELGVPAIIYSPDMCSILPRKENQRYRSDTVEVFKDGVRLTLKEFCDKEGLKYKRVQARLLKGWTLDEAVKPVNKILNPQPEQEMAA